LVSFGIISDFDEQDAEEETGVNIGDKKSEMGF
jgi:hypothetical protein